MKSIQLTEEHRSKLLEMCRLLFPTLKLKFAGEDGDYQGDYLKSKYGVDIHWFEFCMTHLASKLDSIGDISDLCTGENDLGHPIDYLYEQFI